MSASRAKALVTSAILIATAAVVHAETHVEFGRPATTNEIAAWNLDIDREGKALPSGQGSVAQGKDIYAERCSACHGETGEGGLGDRLVGGQGTLASDKPVRTVGSYWPYSTTLFDYVRRAMPLDSPQSLTNDEVYAVSAYLLHLNDIVPADAVIDAAFLAAIRMPNRDGFVDVDPRPDTREEN